MRIGSRRWVLAGSIEVDAEFQMEDLFVHWSTSPSGPVLDAFLEHYDRAFVLPDEKETPQGFRECLALNRGPDHDRLRAQFGPFFEAVIVVRDGAGGFVGGLNLLAYRAPAEADGQDFLGIALRDRLELRLRGAGIPPSRPLVSPRIHCQGHGI